MNSISFTISSIALLFASLATTSASGAETLSKATRATTESSAPKGKYVQLKSLREPRQKTLPELNAGKLPGFAFGSSMNATLPKAQGGVDGTYIYGSLDWSDNWDDDYTPFGIYRLPINGSDAVRFVKINDKLRSNGGGIYKDGKYYFIICYSSLWGTKFPYMSVADTENNWSLIVDEMSVPSTSVATDMTYDAVTDKVYGCFHDEDFWNYNFATLDLETGKTTAIAPIVETMAVVAADNNGRIFAIGSSGKLYEMNKETGEATLIGDTGVSTDYVSSGCFDPATNKLYWNVSMPSGIAGYDVFTYLYEVNTTDATLRQVCQPALNEQFTGMFIYPPKAEAGAPDGAVNLKVTAETDALSGVFEFTMPSETYTGEALSGELDYSVTLQGEPLKNGKAESGATVSLPFTITRSQQCVFEVTVSNEAGSSPVSKIEKWVGPDVPKPVENLKLAYDSSRNGFNLSWELAAKGMHGSPMDAQRVRYTVVRYPGGVTVADRISETSLFDPMPMPSEYTVYHYDVTADFDGNTGETATSNAQSLGNLTTPFIETFDTKAAFDVFTVINPGNDETWAYTDRDGNPCASVRFNVIENMNDWLITPPIAMEADRVYYLEFKASGSGVIWPERIRAAFGKSPVIAAMTTEIIAETELDTDTWQTLTGQITVAEAGNYHFGINGVSKRNNHTLYVDDIKVIPGASLNAPASPQLTASADATGAMNVKLTVTPPTQAINGNTAGTLQKLELYRGNTLIKTFESPSAGGTLTFTDSNPIHGINTYSAKAYNSYGEGDAATASAYAGFDTPSAPANINAVENPQGTVTITWDAPSTGQNGGAIETSSLRYSILRVHDEKVIAERIAETTFSDTPYAGDIQECETYFVVAETNEGIGSGAMSPTLPVGTPYMLPFAESFPQTTLTYSTWLIRRPDGSNATWGIGPDSTVPTASPADGDQGMGVFTPTAPGEEATMISGKLTLKGSANPTLEFYYFYLPGSDKLKVEIDADGSGMQTAATIDYASESGNQGWRKASVPLARYIKCDYLRIGFTGVSGTGSNHIYIDNIKVTDLLNHDLAVTALSVAARPKAGVPTPVTVTVTNFGEKTAENYTVEIYRDGDLQETFNGFSIEPQKSTTYIHSFTPAANDPAETMWEARVIYGSDMNGTNNFKLAYSFNNASAYPGPTALNASGTSDGIVTLVWGAAPTTIEKPTVDGAESYETFAIDNIGKWTMTDCDGSETYSFAQDDGTVYDYPNVTYPMAFQVMNLHEIGFTDNVADRVPPHSGDKMFVCFAATSGRNDDWMISPLLSGNSQIISLFARSFNDMYGLESFELLYSTSGRTLDSFEKIEEVDASAVPVEWTEYVAKLPEGAKYFAIRCTSADRFALLVDDISFTPADAETEELTLKGYNIYRDGVKLNSEPIDATTYTDSTDGNRHTYYVTAVFAEGESARSNTASVGVSAIDTVSVTPDIKVTANGSIITVTLPETAGITIHSADGKLVFAGRDKNFYTAEVSTGVYLVSTGQTTVKIIVK